MTAAIGDGVFIHVTAFILQISMDGGKCHTSPSCFQHDAGNVSTGELCGPEALPTYPVSGPYAERAPRALEGRMCLPDPLASVGPLCSQHDAGHRPNPQAWQAG